MLEQGGNRMSETLHEMAVRMCRGRCGYDCTGCPVRIEIKGSPCLICSLFYTDNADEQIESLKKWASEHPLPKKTWLNMFRESFPNAPRRGDGAPQTCPEALYGSVAENRGCTNGCYDGNCLDCWNREATEE